MNSKITFNGDWLSDITADDFSMRGSAADLTTGAGKGRGDWYTPAQLETALGNLRIQGLDIGKIRVVSESEIDAAVGAKASTERDANAGLLDDVLRSMEALTEGRSTHHSIEKGGVAAVRLGAKIKLIAYWPTRAAHDRDPESIMCGCPLQGRYHAHAEAEYTTTAEAAKTYVQAVKQMEARTLPTFAPGVTVG